MREILSAVELDEKVPLLKTALPVAIEGITRCILGDKFDDQVLVDKISDAYMSAWRELEV